MKTTKARRLESPRGAHNATSIAILALVAVGLGWLLAGCVPSAVHPFYRAADVIRDPALLGVWKDKPNGKECWTFTSGEGLGYTLEVQSDDQHAVFVAFLFKLGNARFLDLYPAKSALEEKLQNNAYGHASQLNRLLSLWERARAGIWVFRPGQFVSVISGSYADLCVPSPGWTSGILNSRTLTAKSYLVVRR